MIKVIRFFGEVLVSLAEILKALSNMLRFAFIIGICMGILMITMLATFEAFHFIQPTDFVPEYGRQLDVFAKDFWAWIVAGLGWVTMIYAANKMLVADNKKNNSGKQRRKEYESWLEE